MIVVDASAFLEYLFRTETGSQIRQVLRGDPDLHVPSLCDVEVAAGLRRALAKRLLDPDHAGLILSRYLELPITRYPHESLLWRVLALRDNFSSYDATYVALAEALDVPLVTADQRLAKAIGAHLEVDVLP